MTNSEIGVCTPVHAILGDRPWLDECGPDVFPPDRNRFAPAILLLTLLALATWHWWDHAVGSIPIPPGVPVLPGGKPLLGHGIQLLSNFHRIHHWLLDCARQMGFKTFAMTVPFQPTSVVIMDPTCLECVLKTKMHNFVKGPRFVSRFKPLFGHGIFVSDGEQWAWQRKLAANIFNVQSFKQYVNVVFGEKIELLHAALLAACRARRPCDLHDLLLRFTLDAFSQLGFGTDPGSLTQRGNARFAVAMDMAQSITISRFWLPAWPLFELLNGDWLRIRRYSAAFTCAALDVVRQRRARQVAGRGLEQQQQVAPGGKPAAAPRDLLSLFMAAEGPDGKPLSERQLVDAVLNFLVAGRDTTAQALSWTTFLLMQHPEVEEKLLAEIQQVLGTAAKPSYDQLQQLHYARACFLEALRLYPSVPMDTKFAVDQDILPDGSPIPKGAQVMYPPFVINRMPRFWGDDAESFRPERWLRLPQLPSPYAYPSFNAGPRICLGQRLAELEGVYVLVSLVARFRLRPARPLAHVTYAVSATLPMKSGLWVAVEERA